MKKKKQVRKIDFVNYAQLRGELRNLDPRQHFKKRRSLHLMEAVFFVLILVIFGFKITGYLHANIFNPVTWVHGIEKGYDDTSYKASELKYFGKCPAGQKKIDIGQEYLCRQPTKASVYQKIYDTYPRDPDGKDHVYLSPKTGNLTVANQLLHDRYSIAGQKPVSLPVSSIWQENPYKSQDWTQNTYSLKIFKDLLYASTTTRQSKYTSKLLADYNSFMSNASTSSQAWSDNQIVAQRSMMLTAMWWNVRGQNALSIADSTEMLQSIEKSGNFLLDSAHYDSASYPDLDEATALYMLGISFPTMPQSHLWLSVGKERLTQVVSQLVNSDGVVVSNSPSQQLELLAKYWDIQNFSAKNHQPIDGLSDKLAKMQNYAIYMVQPDLRVPIMGRSAATKLVNKDEFAQIAGHNSQFHYVISKGRRGRVPSQKSAQFKASGQTIMRSGWTSKNYTQQTQLIYNYGATSTQTGHLDSLGINLYSGGTSLLPGFVLPSNSPASVQSYFTGTSSHNTVLVDGQNQIAGGSATAGPFITTKDYTSQSASDTLNPGVTHERQVILINRQTVVVLDKLTSSTEHTYQQLFHLPPGVQFSRSGSTVTAKGREAQQNLQIRQFVTGGMQTQDIYNSLKPGSVGGICTTETGAVNPCHEVAYTKQGKDVNFVTVLDIGKPQNQAAVTFKNNVLTVQQSHKTYTVKVQEQPAKAISAKASAPTAATPTEAIVDNMGSTQKWQVTDGTLTKAADTYQTGQPTLDLAATTANKGAVMSKAVNLDLSNKNLVFRMKVPNMTNVNDLDLILYSDDSSTAKIALQSSYRTLYDNDQSVPGDYSSGSQGNGWTTVSLGKGSARDSEGQWEISDSNFDWAHINKVAFRVGGSTIPVGAFFGTLSTMPQQQVGKVAIIFDDGTSSILPAVQSMNRYNFHGSVGVIAKYAKNGSNGYLNVSQLKTLQNDGWSLINHSYYHQDAITQYYDANRLPDFTNDLLSGALFLEQNNLDTDPNWYIYPHGSTNTAIEKIVGKYYRFARSELTAPEVYPFGNPLAVKDFVAQNTTSPASINAAIDDAKTYNLTLLITFHRIHAQPSDQSGYDINNFNQIIDHLNKSHVQVVSLRELDESNHVPIQNLQVEPGHPAELASVVADKSSLWQRLMRIL